VARGDAARGGRVGAESEEVEHASQRVALTASGDQPCLGVRQAVRGRNVQQSSAVVVRDDDRLQTHQARGGTLRPYTRRRRPAEPS
jgi:hypothetical protein